MKIQIVGFSGAGKSTLAKELASIYNIPLLYLDNVQFKGNWEERTKEEKIEIVSDFLKSNSSWVIDGNYSSICPERFTDADLTICLFYNRFYCLKMAIRRYKEYKGTCRESCNSPEKFDLEFARWILYEGRTKKKKAKLLNLAKKSKSYLVFKNVKEKDCYLKKLKQNML